MSQKNEKIIGNLIYCFVRISEETKEEKIFLIDSQTVSHVLKKSHKIWLKTPEIRNKERKDQYMRVILRDYNELSDLRTTVKRL